MFKKILTPLTSTVLSLATARSAIAADYGLSGTGKTIGYTGKYESVYGIVNSVVSTFLSLLAILFFVLVVYSGIRWMTARGNEEFSTKAKNILEAAVIGLIIVLLAYALVNFIFGKLGA